MATAKYSALFPNVAPRSRSLLHIIVHGAANLPMIDGRVPRSYVTAQNQATLSTQEVGETINSTNIMDGVSPHWNEMIYTDIPEETISTEELILLVIDQERNLTLVTYRIPWKWFEPFYQYHLNLQKPVKQTGKTACLYVSIIHKRSILSKESIRYFGLEVMLDSFEVPIAQEQSIYAVARIIPDYKAYEQNLLHDNDESRSGINFKPTGFATNQDFVLPDFANEGYPQVSLATKFAKRPIWKHDFLFSQENEKAIVFESNTVALVIEFYPYNRISNSENWSIKGLLGWIAIRLDERTLSELTAPNAVNGLKTEGLLVHTEGDLSPYNAQHLTAETFIRLINDRHPSKNLLLLAAQKLPVLSSYAEVADKEKGIEPIYEQAPSARKVILPKIETIVKPWTPDAPSPHPPPVAAPPPVVQTPVVEKPHPQPVYNPIQHIVVPQPVQQVEKTNGIRFRLPLINPYDLDDIPTEYRAMLITNYPPRRDDDIDGWFDYFQREVAIYKQAIRRIIQDVIQLREQHNTLQKANADLRMKVENFEKKKRVLYEIFEGDKLDKAKIQDIFNGLSARISAQSLEIKENYAKINNYQKELARKNELRAQYDALVRLTQEREAEMKMIKERISKADGLEETVRRQELVIEKLESMITKYMKQKRAGGTFNDVDRTFLSEHAALGLERQQIQRRVRFDSSASAPKYTHEDFAQRNLKYEQELANLKARFQENMSEWGKEKADLLSKIDDLEETLKDSRTKRKPI